MAGYREKMQQTESLGQDVQVHVEQQTTGTKCLKKTTKKIQPEKQTKSKEQKSRIHELDVQSEKEELDDGEFFINTLRILKYDGRDGIFTKNEEHITLNVKVKVDTRVNANILTMR
ncbi:hypothetical protein PoB_005780700 [Plakobranchus ocellatus]|uniref:Uncharacterized protein n=1 Tax=Plakobranchus ocellatus TaxID=259542 RepID=A0AAV4CI41_9GAST|nr:hypothetical protein PoB_005780700 [Plakobranchus ocellatus]